MHGKHSIEDRYTSQLLYVSGTCTLTKISADMNIPYDTLRSWAKREKWSVLKREVAKAVSRDIVRSSQKQVTLYYASIDGVLNTLYKRLTAVFEDEDLVKIRSEETAIKLLLEVLRQKNALIRAVEAAAKGDTMAPDAAYFRPIVSGTGIREIDEVLSSAALLEPGDAALEDFLLTDPAAHLRQTIPAAVRATAEAVLALSTGVDNTNLAAAHDAARLALSSDFLEDDLDE